VSGFILGLEGGNHCSSIEEVTGMTIKCPGQDMRNLRVSLHKCPNCGAEVEIFSDELKVKCQQCGEKVYKDKIPSCIDWCASARQCLGEERWNELRGED
jgi:DNA-directed RNA polymerase subunit RPC12/RpoP